MRSLGVRTDLPLGRGPAVPMGVACGAPGGEHATKAKRTRATTGGPNEPQDAREPRYAASRKGPTDGNEPGSADDRPVTPNEPEPSGMRTNRDPQESWSDDGQSKRTRDLQKSCTPAAPLIGAAASLAALKVRGSSPSVRQRGSFGVFASPSTSPVSPQRPRCCAVGPFCGHAAASSRRRRPAEQRGILDPGGRRHVYIQRTPDAAGDRRPGVATIEAEHRGGPRPTLGPGSFQAKGCRGQGQRFADPGLAGDRAQPERDGPRGDSHRSKQRPPSFRRRRRPAAEHDRTCRPHARDRAGVERRARPPG